MRVLLADALDFAGAVPPASLSVAEGARLYAAHRRAAQGWALGRFLVPATGLADLEAPGTAPLPTLPPEPPWPIAVSLGQDLVGDVRRTLVFAERSSTCRVAALEMRAAQVTDVEAAAATVRPAAERLGTPVYLDLPLSAPVTPLIAAIRTARMRAKGRVGPARRSGAATSASVLEFMLACVGAGVAFKIALDGDRHRETESRPAFLNLCVTAALLAAGAETSTLAAVLAETNPAAFAFDAEGVTWRDQRADLGAIHQARQLLVAVGTSSLDQPLAALPISR